MKGSTLVVWTKSWCLEVVKIALYGLFSPHWSGVYKRASFVPPPKLLLGSLLGCKGKEGRRKSANSANSINSANSRHRKSALSVITRCSRQGSSYLVTSNITYCHYCKERETNTIHGSLDSSISTTKP